MNVLSVLCVLLLFDKRPGGTFKRKGQMPERARVRCK